jgi:glycerol uptake facilitator-like aquaporin
LPTPSLPKRLTAELLGSLLLAATGIGSGIMAERLAGGNVAVALLGNTLATAAALIALIHTFGPISGAHFNPAVSIAFLLEGSHPWRDCWAYTAAQIAGMLLGMLLAHAMFELPLLQASSKARAGFAQALSEFVATFALLATIFATVRSKPEAVPYAVAAIITAGYWFTASTSFANPAITIARSLSDTFAGIHPGNVLLFIAAQLAAAIIVPRVFRYLVTIEVAKSMTIPR